MDATNIDTSNKFFVNGGGETVGWVPVSHRLPNKEALIFAAWIVALADPLGADFGPILEKVLNS
jgi:hypothetical protein